MSTISENKELFNDIRDLCVYSAKGIAFISKKHDVSPQMISKLYVEVFQKIIEEIEK